MTVLPTDAERVAQHARRLPLAEAVLHEAYYYQSLGLCVIDAVFSINALYAAVENVVRRYCAHYGLNRIRDQRDSPPPIEHQEPVAVLAQRIDELGAERFAAEVFRNRQRTSARSGILKAQAVHRFADALRRIGVNHFQDVARARSDPAFERAVRSIPGQSRGISLQYFWMLSGSDDLVKPDRHVISFVQAAIDRVVAPDEAGRLLTDAAWLLRAQHPHLSPRLLDYEVWRFESQRG